MKLSRQIEIEGAEALLDVGVSIPVGKIRLPFGRHVPFRLTMRRPYLSTQIRIAKIYLGLGKTYEEMLALDKDGQMKFLAEHGKDISRMIALTICRGPLSARLFCRSLAWFLRHFVEDRYLMAANLHFVCLMGTQNFMNIIRSAEIANPMRIRLTVSQDTKGS